MQRAIRIAGTSKPYVNSPAPKFVAAIRMGFVFSRRMRSVFSRLPVQLTEKTEMLGLGGLKGRGRRGLQAGI